MSSRKSKTTLLSNLTELRKTAEAYISAPDDYVRSFTVQINGKRRHIITYTPDSKGSALKNLHSRFATTISFCYQSMPNSYAYKKGSDILQCIEQHLLSNTFLKTDIHEFFNSIQYDILLDEILKDKACQRHKSIITLLLKACFYGGHMPIGFITSPVLSDLYLHDVDKMFLERDDIVFTRYADDFIISGNSNLNALESIKTELIGALRDRGLELNKKKTYYRQFNGPGDAIHLLGVNLVCNGAAPNRITISDRYIRDTSKEICGFMNEYASMLDEVRTEELLKLRGKIEFICHFSASSYKKLEKMVSIKRGETIDLEYRMWNDYK